MATDVLDRACNRCGAREWGVGILPMVEAALNGYAPLEGLPGPSNGLHVTVDGLACWDCMSELRETDRRMAL